MDYIQRMEKEEKELNGKWLKLTAFIGSEKYFELNFYQQKKLIEQQTYMFGYLEVLRDRIKDAKTVEKTEEK